MTYGVLYVHFFIVNMRRGRKNCVKPVLHAPSAYLRTGWGATGKRHLYNYFCLYSKSREPPAPTCVKPPGPSSLTLETPTYEPVTPARAAPPNGSQFEKPFDELQMALDCFPSDGSARGEEPSDLQLDQEETDNSELVKDTGEDDEMGDNF
jgi:hypothetical protein